MCVCVRANGCACACGVLLIFGMDVKPKFPVTSYLQPSAIGYSVKLFSQSSAIGLNFFISMIKEQNDLTG